MMDLGYNMLHAMGNAITALVAIAAVLLVVVVGLIFVIVSLW